MGETELKVAGALIQGYAQACLNLHIVAGRRASQIINDIDMTDWYPLSHWTSLERIVLQSYTNAGPIMLRVGMEMMNAWYHHGPGKEALKQGVDFLHYQTSSQGYVSVVNGPEDLVGKFELVSVDPDKGRALVHSTTPFNRKMECGVLIGGMLAPGDLDYIDIINEEREDYLEIEFH